MKTHELRTPTGLKIIGIYQVITAIAPIDGLCECADGGYMPNYDGETVLQTRENHPIRKWHYDGNRVHYYIANSNVDSQLDRVYVDEQNGEWQYDQLTVTEAKQ